MIKPNIGYACFSAVIILGLAYFGLQDKPKYFSELPNEFGMRFIENGEDAPDYIKSQMGTCFRNDNQNKCYKAVADLFVDQFPVEVILEEFSEGERSQEIFSRCHETTHYLGRRAFEIEGSVPKLFSKGTSSCWGGFYHGVIEGYFEAKKLYTNPDRTLLSEEIKNVCGNRKDFEIPRIFGECVHGIGHALMFISNSDLPQSLRWCDELPESSRETCYGGVFMENSSSSTSSDHPTQYIKADDPLYPCNMLSEQYLSACYKYQSSYFARLANWDWVKNAELCMKVPEAHQASCFRIVGTNQVGSTQEPPKMYKICQSMPTLSSKKECVNGVINGLSGRYLGDPSKMTEFCNLADDELKSICWESIGNSTSDWSTKKDQADVVCVAQESTLADICRKAYLN